jgi:hypothetical protein
MKILLPADENERRRVKESLEAQLRQATGGHWRVYIVPGRYGWYARAEQVRACSLTAAHSAVDFAASTERVVKRPAHDMVGKLV